LEIELLVTGFSSTKRSKPCRRPDAVVRFLGRSINDNDRLEFCSPAPCAKQSAVCAAAPVVCIDHEQHAVHHFHDPLDFASKICVTGRINDVDPIAVPLKGCVLRANRNSFLTPRSIESITRSSIF